MSRAYTRGDEPLSLVPFTESLLDDVTAAARSNPRKRSIVRFHEHDEYLQRMLNSIEPETYTRPHRHLNPPKPEAFVALRGTALIVRFADDGLPLEGVAISVQGSARGVEIPAGAWHCIVSLEPGTVVFEVIQGPYDEATHKEFAPWAPPEEDTEAGSAFIAGLRETFEKALPETAAIDRIQAEEYDIC